MSHILKSVAEKRNKKTTAQSKEWILQALLMLMQKKAFERITIKEVSEKAGIDRKTFYRNFVSKFDVLKLYSDQLGEEYIKNLKKEKKLDIISISKVYFECCLKEINFLKILDKNNMLTYLMTYDKYLPKIYKILNPEEIFDDPIYDYAFTFFTGGFWNLTVQWIRANIQKTPMEMADIAEKIIMKNILLNGKLSN